MAGPQNDPPDITMLEVATPATTTPTIAFSSQHYQSIPSVVNGPVMISMSQEEYITRTSRESVLQRLSEALLRHSLAKVSNNHSMVCEGRTFSPICKGLLGVGLWMDK